MHTLRGSSSTMRGALLPALRRAGQRQRAARRSPLSTLSSSDWQQQPELPPDDCVKFEDIVRAHHRIRSGVVRTECSPSHWLSQLTGCNLYFKKEQLQFTGSFKERGARNAIMSLDHEQRKAGVIAASAGNHALALAWHGPQLDVPVTVVMPTVAPMTKVPLRVWRGVCGAREACACDFASGVLCSSPHVCLPLNESTGTTLPRVRRCPTAARLARTSSSAVHTSARLRSGR
eukprot:1679556-Prymnesium_polylepis.1